MAKEPCALQSVPQGAEENTRKRRRFRDTEFKPDAETHTHTPGTHARPARMPGCVRPPPHTRRLSRMHPCTPRSQTEASAWPWRHLCWVGGWSGVGAAVVLSGGLAWVLGGFGEAERRGGEALRRGWGGG